MKIRQRVVELSTLGFAVAMSLLVLNNPPIYSGRFLGDDLQMWGGHLDGTFASNLQESVRHVGIDKWRPVNTTVMILVFRSLGDSYINFYWLSSAVIALIMIGLYVVSRAIAGGSQRRGNLIPLLGAVVVGTSPFTFAGRAGVIGFLEFAPVLFCLGAFYLYQSAKRQGSRRLVVYSAILSLIAGLTHERFFLFSLALAIVIFVHGRREVRFRGFWLLYVANYVFYFFVSMIVLDTDAFRGGGEIPLSASFGWWILYRLVFSILHLFGAAGGEAVFFRASEPSQFLFGDGFATNYSLGFPIALATILLISVVYGARRLRQSRQGKASRTVLPASAEALVVAIALLIPSATVISRIESRWLFASLVFLCLAVIVSSNSLNPVSIVLSLLFLGMILVSNISHRGSYEKFDFWKFRAAQVVDAVRQNAPNEGPWNVAIVVPAYDGENVSAKATSEASPRDQRGSEVSEENQDLRVLVWALGYGNDEPYQPLDNPPRAVGFKFNEAEALDCPRPCLIVSVKEVGNVPFDVRRLGFQRVSVRWL